MTAVQAIEVALTAPIGSPARAQLSKAARDEAIQALAAISSDRFWVLVSPGEVRSGMSTTHEIEIEVEHRDGIRDALMSLIGGSLTQILTEVGYRPPPPGWELVAAARRAVDEAFTWGTEVDYALLRRQLSRLMTALSVLSLDGNPEDVGSAFSRVKQALVGGAVMASVLLGQVDGVLDDVRHEVLYPAVTHVWGEIMDHRPESEPPVRQPSIKPIDGELWELQLATERAKLAEAEARLAEAETRREIARLEALLMTERLEEERGSRDY